MATLGTLRRTAVRFCPKCVVEAVSNVGLHGISQMQEWGVTSLHSCHVHNCLLMTLPSSQHAHTAYDFVNRVADHMDEVLRQSRSTKVVLPTQFEHYVRARIWQGAQEDWLKEFDLTQIHRLCLNLGARAQKSNGATDDQIELSARTRFVPFGVQIRKIGTKWFCPGT